MKEYTPIHENFVRFCQARAHKVMSYEDLVSEATLKAYQNWEKIKKKDSLKYFLFTTARNIILNQVRKKGEEDIEKVDYQIEGAMNSAELDLEIAYLYEQLNKISEAKREALILFEINGFSIKEIAVIQDVSEGLVKVNLSRGRKELRALMTDMPKQAVETVAI